MAEYQRPLRRRVSPRRTTARPLFPGADATLRRLAARDDVALGLATGKSRRGVAGMLDGQGWGSLLVTIQTADDAPSKPHPGMVLQAMAETGADPDATVVVGDTTFDIEMARAAGCRRHRRRLGPPSRRRRCSRQAPSRIVDSFDELWP